MVHHDGHKELFLLFLKETLGSIFLWRAEAVVLFELFAFSTCIHFAPGFPLPVWEGLYLEAH